MPPKASASLLIICQGAVSHFANIVNLGMKATNHSNLGLTAMLGVAPGGAVGDIVRSQGTQDAQGSLLRAARAWNR